MPRSARVQPGGVVFHGLNLGNEKRDLFEDADDYTAFLHTLADAMREIKVK